MIVSSSYSVDVKTQAMLYRGYHSFDTVPFDNLLRIYIAHLIALITLCKTVKQFANKRLKSIVN